MTTLTIVYKRTERGAVCVGLCDARCYNAMPPTQLKEPRRNACQCICGGRNHAGGINKALQNAQAGTGMDETDVQRFADERGHDRSDLVVIDRLRVRSLFKARQLAQAMLDPAPRERDLFSCQEVSA